MVIQNNTYYDNAYVGYNVTAADTFAKEMHEKSQQVQEAEKSSKEKQQESRNEDQMRDQQEKNKIYSKSASYEDGGNTIGYNLDLYI